MRIYQSATIEEERLTGFQSPCSEFAEKPLSLDERFGIGNPSLHFIQAQTSNPGLNIYKGDWLIIDLGRSPGPHSLVAAILGDDIKLFRGLKHPELEEAKLAVVTTVIRDFRPASVYSLDIPQKSFTPDLPMDELCHDD